MSFYNYYYGGELTFSTQLEIRKRAIKMETEKTINWELRCGEERPIVFSCSLLKILGLPVTCYDMLLINAKEMLGGREKQMLYHPYGADRWCIVVNSDATANCILDFEKELSREKREITVVIHVHEDVEKYSRRKKAAITGTVIFYVISFIICFYDVIFRFIINWWYVLPFMPPIILKSFLDTMMIARTIMEAFEQSFAYYVIN